MLNIERVEFKLLAENVAAMFHEILDRYRLLFTILKDIVSNAAFI